MNALLSSRPVIRFAILLLFTSLPSSALAIAVGDLTMLGFGTDTPDKMSFVSWVNVAGGTQLYFTDETFDGTNFSTNAESGFLWTVPAGGLTIGQVVVAAENELGADQVVDAGGTVTGEIASLSDAGDNLFIFEGTDTTDTVLFGMNFANNNGWLTSGTASLTDSYLPPTLNVVGGNLDMFSTSLLDNGQYVGLGSFNSVAAAKASVLNLANWSFINSAGSFVLDSTDFTITPEPSASLIAILAAAAFPRLRRRLRPVSRGTPCERGSRHSR
jgi:hypothetical protein